LKSLVRGLFALILTTLFHTNIYAEYLYKDEVTKNPQFKQDVETLGKELYEKTGIKVKLVMLKMLPKGMSIVDYEKSLAKNAKEPTVYLTFSQLDQRVDILAYPHSLYQYFDKKQILSPVASWLQSFFMAVFFTHNWEEFKETVSDYGGTIIPLLAQKSKAKDEISKYSAAMFNGYADLVDQIAKNKGVELEHSVGNANQKSIFFVKLFFYGFILYAIFMYIKITLRKKREHK
jgi:hypothetical protein